MRELSRQDLSDILHGCTILGTGGGGEIAEGFDYIDEALSNGKSFRLIDVDEVPAGETVCTPYMLGAISALSDSEEAKYARLRRSGERPIMTAYQKLKAREGRDCYGTICCELGGSNTAISFYLAAMFDGYIIDADPAGRAVPEITHSTYYLNGLPASPIYTANEFGECFVCDGIIDDQRAEHIVRALAMVSRNDIAAIDHCLPIESIRHSVIKGTITKALELGRAYRLARTDGVDLATEIAMHGRGVVAFRGRIKDATFRTEGGFTLGDIHIEGVGEYADSSYHIAVKNENMIAWLNGEIAITIPDLICMFDVDKKEPVTNPNALPHMNVAIVVLPAPAEFTTAKALSVFGPEYLGLDSPYKPAVPNPA